MLKLYIGINDINKPLTPTKTYGRSRNEMTELIFPSPSSITDTPKRKIINYLIDMPTPNSKRLIYADEDDTPRKKKLKLKIDQQKIKLRNKNIQVCKLKQRVNKLVTHYEVLCIRINFNQKMQEQS
jgi:hypothetical protein